MKELSKLQNFIYAAGGVLIIIGALLWPTNWQIATGIYCIGAIAFSSIQFICKYEGDSIVINRLRKQQLIGAFMLLATGALMIVSKLQLGYLQHNEWMVGLSIAALLECYTAFRIPYELKRKD